MRAAVITGFVIFFPLLFTVGWWLLARMPGFDELRRDDTRAWWALASTQWAFVRASQPGVTPSAALQLALAALFALTVACAGPPVRWCWVWRPRCWPE
jgi:hypothetical protein